MKAGTAGNQSFAELQQPMQIPSAVDVKFKWRTEKVSQKTEVMNCKQFTFFFQELASQLQQSIDFQSFSQI